MSDLVKAKVEGPNLTAMREILAVALEQLQRQGLDRSSHWTARRVAFLLRCAIAVCDHPQIGALWVTHHTGGNVPTVRNLVALEAMAARIPRPWQAASGLGEAATRGAWSDTVRCWQRGKKDERRIREDDRRLVEINGNWHVLWPDGTDDFHDHHTYTTSAQVPPEVTMESIMEAVESSRNAG